MFEVRDGNGKIASLILQTDNNQKKNEDNTVYTNNSLGDLSKVVPESMYDKDLVIFKINQCVINPHEKSNGHYKTIYHGHVVTGLFKIENSTQKLFLYPDSTISKSKKGIEPHEFIYNSRFFYCKDIADEAREKGSKEFFWLISLDKLNMSRQTYLMRCQDIRISPGVYDLYKSACGQAIYTLITDRSAPEVKSPQTATVQAVLDVISNDDVEFKSNLQNQLIASGLSKFAYDLGQEFLGSTSNSLTQSRS